MANNDPMTTIQRYLKVDERKVRVAIQQLIVER